MDLGLKNKVALITGGSKGIGKGIALALAAEGCALAICARTKQTLKETAAELRQFNVPVFDLNVDVTDVKQSQGIIERVVTELGGLDILVNNIGGNRRNLFEETTEKDWDEMIDLNLQSHIRVCSKAVPYMKKQKHGSIIFISSIFGREAGGKTLSIYNTTKSAMISLAKIMAIELAGHGIRVNSVAPGSIRFPGGSWDKRVQKDPEGMKKFVEQELPLGRFGTVEEVANVVCFLASDKASLVTGACINVDGGQSRSLI